MDYCVCKKGMFYPPPKKIKLIKQLFRMYKFKSKISAVFLTFNSYIYDLKQAKKTEEFFTSVSYIKCNRPPPPRVAHNSNFQLYLLITFF